MKSKKYSLATRLTAYSGAVAGLILTSQEANAFIVYEDFDPDLITLPDDTLFIDIDGDGIDDISLWVQSQTGILYTASGAAVDYVYRFAYASALGQNRLFGTEASSGGYLFNSAYQFASGELIGGSTLPNFNGKARLAVHIGLDGSDPINIGPWSGVTDGMMGVKFNVGENEHFAWLRLTIPEDAASITLSELAWDNQADVGGISAGLTAEIYGQNEIDAEIWSFDDQVFVQTGSEVQIDAVQLLSIDGKEINHNLQFGNPLVIRPAEPFASGIYFVILVSEGRQFTKKIYLDSL